MPAGRAFNLQRRERLMGELRRHGEVRVSDLATLLEVSDVTVRRDIVALAQQKLLTKVHGGAVLPTSLYPPPRRTRAAPTRFTVGMVVPSLDFFWPQIIAGARSAAAALGVNIQLRGSSYDAAEDRRQVARLIDAGQVQGLLLAPEVESVDADPLIGWIGALPVPCILIEREPPSWTPTLRQLEWVRTDHRLGVESGVRHLHHHGHRRIGLVLSPESPTSEHLARAWTATCVDLGLPADLITRESVRLAAPGHREIIADLLRSCAQSGITALVVHSDPDALSIAQFCSEQGIVVPRDLAIVSYDDEVAHLADPALTAISPAKSHVGRVAVELMVSRLIEGNRRPSQRVLVAPELVIRGSSVPPPR